MPSVQCPPPNIVYPCCSSPRKHFPSISPSIVARTTLSLLVFQWQYLESSRCLICSKQMPFSSGISIFSRIHVLVFRFVQVILSIRRHTHISEAVTRILVTCKEWIIPDIRNWHSTDMCMGQEDKEDPRKDGLTWWRMTVSNVTSTFIKQQRWLNIVRQGGA